MKRETYPECKENGSEKDITDDSNPRNCNINLKRVDSVCSDWTEVSVKNKSDWLSSRERQCIDGSHQEMTENANKSAREYFYWLKFVHDKFTAYEAIKNCRNLGGQLFGDFNGSREQIWFLAEQFDFFSFWVGFNDIEQSGEWKNLKGKDSSLVPWRTGQPTNLRDESFTIALSQFLSEDNPMDIIGNCLDHWFRFLYLGTAKLLFIVMQSIL